VDGTPNRRNKAAFSNFSGEMGTTEWKLKMLDFQSLLKYAHLQ